MNALLCLGLFSIVQISLASLYRTLDTSNCDLQTSAHKGKPRVTVRGACTEGKIQWNYPSGKLKIVVRGKQTFCIHSNVDQDVNSGEIWMKGVGKQPFEVPKANGEKKCFDLSGRTAVVILEGPETVQSYMDEIRYSGESYKRPRKAKRS